MILQIDPSGKYVSGGTLIIAVRYNGLCLMSMCITSQRPVNQCAHSTHLVHNSHAQVVLARFDKAAKCTDLLIEYLRFEKKSYFDKIFIITKYVNNYMYIFGEKDKFS